MIKKITPFNLPHFLSYLTTQTCAGHLPICSQGESWLLRIGGKNRYYYVKHHVKRNSIWKGEWHYMGIANQITNQKSSSAYATLLLKWCSGRDLNPRSAARKAAMLDRATPPEPSLSSYHRRLKISP